MNQKTRVKKSNRNTARSSSPVRSAEQGVYSRKTPGTPVFAYPDEPQAFPIHSSSSAPFQTDRSSYTQKKDLNLFVPPSQASSDDSRTGNPRSDNRSSDSQKLHRLSSSYTTLSDSAFTPTDENEAYARQVTARKREERLRAERERARKKEEQKRAEEERLLRAEEQARREAERLRRNEERVREESEHPRRERSVPRVHTQSYYEEAPVRRRKTSSVPKNESLQNEADYEVRHREPARRSKEKINRDGSAYDAYSQEYAGRPKKKNSTSAKSKAVEADKQTMPASSATSLPAYLQDPTPPKAYHEIPVRVSRKKKPKKNTPEPQLSDHQPLLDYMDGKKQLNIQSDKSIRIPAHIHQPEEAVTDLQTAIPVKEGTGDTRPHAIKKERESRRKRDERLTYMLVIFVVLFAVSAFFLIRIFWGYSKASSEYNQLASEYVEVPDGADQPVNSNTYADRPYPDLKINFPSLFAINNECIGWIYVPGCGISYPIVKGTDNDFYLSHTFEKASSSNGAIFMDYQDKTDLTSFNTFIYGHDMKDGSMFASLFKYGTDPDLINAYPYFFVYLMNGNVMKYHICSFYTNDGNSDSFLRVDTSEQKTSYVAMILAKSAIVKTESGANSHLATATDNFVTLSTCHGTEQRFLVHGYLEGIYNTLTNTANELYPENTTK